MSKYAKCLLKNHMDRSIYKTVFLYLFIYNESYVERENQWKFLERCRVRKIRTYGIIGSDKIVQEE